ncbi:MAG TPA: SPFH domain-containing protein [Stellaceae bacterium]|nr:SPFH domain-containing protein [Stellaceae bacterium]
MENNASTGPWGARQPKAAFPIGPRQIALLLVALALLAVVPNAIYTIEPPQLGFTRTFGRVDQAPDQPLTPGVHLKWPLITTVDRIQVSTDTVNPPADLRVLSHDGQVISLGVSLTRKIPAAAVYNLLYNTGAVGNVDIDRNMFAIVADRTLTIFGREDVLNIATERERIIGLMKTVISADLRRLFGIELVDLQITGFRFSPEYEHAVNENTLAKTNAYKAEQILKQKQIEAQQAAAEAKGQADAAIEAARGQSQSRLLNATAEGQATEIQAKADSTAIRLRVEAAGGTDAYAKLMAADTMKKWNGQPAQTILGGGTSPVPFFQVGPAK